MDVIHTHCAGLDVHKKTVVYIVDSFPVAVCDNYRIMRCRIYQGEAWRGYLASKRRY